MTLAQLRQQYGAAIVAKITTHAKAMLDYWTNELEKEIRKNISEAGNSRPIPVSALQGNVTSTRGSFNPSGTITNTVYAKDEETPHSPLGFFSEDDVARYSGGYDLNLMFEHGWELRANSPLRRAKSELINSYGGTHAVEKAVNALAGRAAADNVIITMV